MSNLINRLEHIAGLRRVPPLQGAIVAVNSFWRAFLRLGHVDQCFFFAAPGSAERIRQAIEDEIAGSPVQSSIAVKTFSELVQTFTAYGFTHWLDLTCNFESPSSLRRRLSARLFPIIVTHHTISYHWLMRSDFIPMVLAESYPFDSVVCTSTAARTAVARLLDRISSELKRELKIDAQFHGRLDVIPLGVDTDRFRPQPKEPARRQLKLPRNAFIILYLGRISAVDKADLIPFILVFHDLVKSNPQTKLLFVIAGTQVDDYGERIAQCVRECGLSKRVQFIMSPQDSAILYSAADIFVSPIDNIQESFGLSVIEAMACGLPQVVSDWNGYRDTVVDGETGFLVPTCWMECDGDLCDTAPLFGGDASFDHASLAQSVAVDLRTYRDRLQRLISDRDLLITMGHYSRQRAVNCFAWPSVMRRYRSLWTELGAMAAVDRGSSSPGSALHPHYFDVFGHYASRKLTGASLLRIASEDVAHTVMQQYHLAHQRKLLDHDLLQKTLSTLQEQELKCDTLVEYLKAVPQAATYHRHLLYRHIMWLLKYGFIEIVK